MNANRIFLVSLVALAAVGLALTDSVAADSNNNPGENSTNLPGDQPDEGSGGGGNPGNNNPGENNTNLQGNQPKDS